MGQSLQTEMGNFLLPLAELMAPKELTTKELRFCLHMKNCIWGKNCIIKNQASCNGWTLQIPFKFPNVEFPIMGCRGT